MALISITSVGLLSIIPHVSSLPLIYFSTIIYFPYFQFFKSFKKLVLSDSLKIMYTPTLEPLFIGLITEGIKISFSLMSSLSSILYLGVGTLFLMKISLENTLFIARIDDEIPE